jgi:bifunctional DNA-binding transcriptional regulator/antitoxin component of YhaV-PrlF toxin-antitoxin module
MNLGSNTIYPVEVRKYSDKASISTAGEYLEVPLSDDVEELGLGQGDKLYMVLDRSDTDTGGYLKISADQLEDRGRVHSLLLKKNEASSPSYAVSIPAEYSVHSGLSPFQGLEQGDTVIVEVDNDDELIRVYQPSDYRSRLEKLVENESTPDIRVPTVLAGLYQGKSLQQITSEVGEWRIKPYHQLNGGYIEDSAYVEVFDEEDRLIDVLSGDSEYLISLPAGIYYLEIQVPGYRFKRTEVEIIPGFTNSGTIRLYTKRGY